MEEKLIDILWEVKEGKTHPNRAYKRILNLVNYDSESPVGHCNKCGENCDYC